MSIPKRNPDYSEHCSEKNWSVEPAQLSNQLAQSMAELHIAEIPSGFLSSLGEKFLTAFYYAVLKSPETIVHIASYNSAKNSDLMLGFICSARNSDNFYRGVILSNWVSLSLALAPKILRASTVRKVWETLRFTRGVSSKDCPRDGAAGQSARVLNFCVDSEFHGQGVAKALYQIHLKDLQRLGINSLAITTGNSQLRARGFYQKMGARTVGYREVHAGVQSVDLIHPLGELPPEKPIA